jgi:hypothetical protein
MLAGKKHIRLIFLVLFATINLMVANGCRAEEKQQEQQQQEKMTGEKLKEMTPQQRADFQTGLMKSKLKLDTQQIVKIKALNLKYALKMQPIIKSDDSRFSKFRQAKSLLEQKDGELKLVFTDAQFKQYKDFESEMRKKMQSKMNN